jgi:hypothetical protein
MIPAKIPQRLCAQKSALQTRSSLQIGKEPSANLMLSNSKDIPIPQSSPALARSFHCEKTRPAAVGVLAVPPLRDEKIGRWKTAVSNNYTVIAANENDPRHNGNSGKWKTSPQLGISH